MRDGLLKQVVVQRTLLHQATRAHAPHPNAVVLEMVRTGGDDDVEFGIVCKPQAVLILPSRGRDRERERGWGFAVRVGARDVAFWTRRRRVAEIVQTCGCQTADEDGVSVG